MITGPFGPQDHGSCSVRAFDEVLSMSHFEELSVWESPGATIETLRAVGWLERGWAYSKGEVTEPFFEALLNLLVRPWWTGSVDLWGHHHHDGRL